jgi:peptidoglycan/LPS O-acetylase OafA/YrhL
MDRRSSSSPSNSRLDGIDLLRTLAILFVLMNHVNVRLSIAKVPFKQGLPPALVHALFYNGQNGVRIFFAISGFLIASMSLRRWGSFSRIDVTSFYRLRAARIAPLLFLLLAILSALHLAGASDFVISAKRGGWPNALFSALTFHINWMEAHTGYLPGNWDILWSLSVEEVFYLGFPLLCRMFGSKLWLPLLVFVAAGPFARTAWAHGNELWSDYSYLSGMDAIALGCLTAFILPDRRLSRSLLRASGLSGVALMCAVLLFPIRALDHSGLDMTVLALGTCLVIVPAAQSARRLPGLLLALGRRSYEVYMTHMFAVFAGLHVFLLAGKPMWMVPVYFAATILAAGALGEAVARLYSDPMNYWVRGPSGRTS